VVGTTGCAADGEAQRQPVRATDADCTVRVRFDGVIYQWGNRLDPKEPRGRTVGHGALIDCLGKRIGGGVASRYQVRVVAVRGAAATIAIVIPTGQAQGMYVAEELPRSEWPSVIRRR
jgi:hypothetical protein